MGMAILLTSCCPSARHQMSGYSGNTASRQAGCKACSTFAFACHCLFCSTAQLSSCLVSLLSVMKSCKSVKMK